MGGIDVGDTGPLKQLLGGYDVELRDLVRHPLAEQPRARDRAIEHLASVANELCASAVDAREQQCACAGALLELEAQLQPLAVDAVAADRQNGRLRQTRQRLVDRADREVRTLVECGRGQV